MFFLVGLLLFAQTALPNGIHVRELPAEAPAEVPAEADVYEVVAGYRAGVRDEPAATGGLASSVAAFLAASASAREMAIAAYGSGGQLEFSSDLDLTMFRLRVPMWAKPMLEQSIVSFFSETPGKDPAVVDRAIALARGRAALQSPETDFEASVEDEIRSSLLGNHPYQHRRNGLPEDFTRLSREDVGAFFQQNYGTDRAFLIVKGALPAALASIPRRDSQAASTTSRKVLAADRTLRFSSDLPTGSVILAVPLPSVYYEGWFAVLMLDQLIQQLVPGNPRTELVPTIDPYYYRVEVPVPAGEFAQPTEETLVQEIDRLQYARASSEALEEARKNAIAYLDSAPIRDWFLAMGIPERRDAGIEMIKAFTADEMRAAARDLLISNRVIASWAPRPRQTTVEVESLDAGSAAVTTAAEDALAPLAPVTTRAFPPHQDPPFSERRAERLSSGVSVMPGVRHAVFVAPDILRTYDEEPGPEVLQSFATYRPGRILVMAPPDALQSAKTLWSGFRGNTQDNVAVEPKGDVTSGDLPALLLLKLFLDRKLIETGLWTDVQLGITAAEGATLSINGSEANRLRVVGWIKEIASRPLSDAEMAWAREAATHRLALVLPALQGLIWQRDPEGTFPDIRFISAGHIQDVARIYFQ